MTPAEIGQRRQSLGLSQQALAVQLGVAVTTVSRWETGRVPVPEYLRLVFVNLRKVSEITGLPEAEILERLSRA